MASTVGTVVSRGSPGHIEGLELVDFKSYKGKHYVGPFRDFTCIIGPNGSGKSNIMDAISFVLGVKTISLRAANMKELVYNVEEDTIPKRATVSMHFVAKDDDRKTVFTRSVLATTGAFEYAVDGAAVSWAKYERTLKSFNILSSTRNCLIFQGEVETMAHKGPKELTEMIEMVAGSLELKKDYEEKLKAYKTAAEKLRVTGAQKRGAGVEHGIMKMHKAEAQRYYALMNDLSVLKTEHAMLQFYHIETALFKAKGMQDVAMAHVKEREAANAAVEDAARKLKERIAQLHKDSLKAMKTERETQHKLMARRRAAAQNEVETRTLLAKAEKIKAQLAAAEKVAQSSSSRLEQLSKDLAEQQNILDGLEKKWTAEDQQGTLSDKDYAEFRRLRETAQSETVAFTAEQKQHRRELEHCAQQIVALETVSQENARRLTAVRERVETFGNRQSEIGQQGDEASQQKEELARDLMNTRGLIERHRADLQKKEAALRQVTDEIAGMRSDRDESKTAQKMRHALEDMQGLFNGVRGRLCDLVTIPNKRHRIAVTVALGKHMDSIVTDTDRTAHECVQYLKDQRVGTMNFIPLASVRGKDVTDAHKVLGGTAKPVVDCITYEPWLAPAIKYAVGQAIMVDDLQEGQKVAWDMSTRHKVVTIDGTVLQKNGVMTGGAAAIEARARKFDEKLLESRKEAREKLAQEIRALHVELLRAEESDRELAQQVEAEKQRSQFAKSDLDQWAAKRKQAEGEEKALAKEQSAFAPRLAKLREQRGTLEARLAAVQQKITAVESSIFGTFGQRVNIRDIRDFEKKELDRVRDRASRKTAVATVMTRLQAQIDFERKRDQPVAPEALKKELKRLVDETKQRRADDGKRKKEEHDTEKEHADAKAALDTKNRELKEAEAEQKRAKKQLDAKTEASDDARKKRQQLLTLQEKLRAQRSALYIRCVADDIDLPVVSNADVKRKRMSTQKPNKGGPGKHVEAEEEEGTTETLTDAKGYITVSEVFTSSQMGGRDSTGAKKKTTSDIAKQSKQQLLGIDFTSLSEGLRESVRKGADAYKQQLVLLDHSIEKIHDEMDKLAPNLKAEEKYKGAKGKVKETTESWTEANDDHKKAWMEFAKVKEARYTKFQEAFDTIHLAVSKIYGALTEGTRGQASGTAYIASEEPEEPYLGGTKFSACPPMKQFREMEQLSGGEKTVAALALIFAIHKVCPSPFFVLDEVDAALDKGNVDKVIHYVQSTASSCQFLVISLKEHFYQTAHSLVGVHKVPRLHSSAVKTLDLTQFA